MKKLSTLLFGLLMLGACSQEHSKDYLSISINLENNKDSIIVIASRQKTIKEIKVNAKGIFKDTMKLKNKILYNANFIKQGSANLFKKWF